MPWPERNLTSRFLAGIVNALLGAFLGFLVVVVWFRYWTWTHSSGMTLVSIGCAAGAGLGFVAGFWWGDPATRLLMRLIGRRGPAA